MPGNKIHVTPVASTPEPPYTAVVLTARRADDDDGYLDTALRMVELAAMQPGYLGIESVQDARSGTEITVSYWTDEARARAWKHVAEHVAAQRLGIRRWYSDYRVRVSTVVRDYGPPPVGP